MIKNQTFQITFLSTQIKKKELKLGLMNEDINKNSTNNVDAINL